MGEYVFLLPVIESASFSVNPSVINGKTVLTVSVVEQQIVLEPEKYYSGELYAGEV